MENINALKSIDTKPLKADFAAVEKEIAEKSANILAIKVSSVADFQKLELEGKAIKGLSTRIEKRRKEIVAPYNQYVKDVKALTDILQQLIDDALEHVKSQTISWSKKLEADRIEAQRKLDEENRRKEEEARAELARQKEENEMASAFLPENEAAALDVSHQVHTTVVTQQIQNEAKREQKIINSMTVKGIKKVWKFKIVQAEIVPCVFHVIDETAIRNAIAAGTRDIPGVRIYQEDQVSIRS